MTQPSLFALTNDPSKRIALVPLAAPVQVELATLFDEQEADFRSNAAREIPFDGKYKPDSSECLVIDNFDDIDGIKNAIINSSNIPTIAPNADSLSEIKALFSGRVDSSGNPVILLQSFEKRRIISTRGLLTLYLDSQHYSKFSTIGLTIDDKLSLIIDGRKLKFFSFHVARQVFDLSEYYTIATDQDITDFVSTHVVKVLDTTKFLSNSDTWVRRKIALIKQSGVLDKVPLIDIRRVAAEFGVDINVDSNSGNDMIVMPEEKAELKKLLRFLDEDYYKSSLRALPHLTNSKIRL